NLLRLIDFFFPLAPFVPGVLLVLLTKSHKRLGDMAAGTIVVRDRPIEHALAAVTAAAAAAEPTETGPPDLSEEEFRLLDRFLARLGDLAPEVQVRLTHELAGRFAAKVPSPHGPGTAGGDAEQYLLDLFAAEQRKRRGRFAARARTGGGVAGRPSIPAQRFVARNAGTGGAFHREARGQTYAQADPGSRPPIAAWIISNNIWVCFGAFAGGLLAGVWTVCSLVFNGLVLGLAFGVFGNFHATAYLLTFVAGHGVLE